MGGGGTYGAAAAMMQSGYQPQQGMVAYDQRGAIPGYPGVFECVCVCMFVVDITPATLQCEVI